MTNDKPDGRLTRYLVLVAILGFFNYLLYGLGGALFWSPRKLGESIGALLRGEYSAPSSIGLLFYALFLGGPLLCLSTLVLRRRLLKGEPVDTSRTVRGFLWLVAGVAVFTFFAPLVFLSNPVFAAFVGAAFLLRALALLPTHGSLARQRWLVLVGISLYWLVYWTYEKAMEELAKSEPAEIRIDIVIFYPLLFLLGAAGVWLAFDRRSEGPNETVRPGLSGRVGV